MNYKLKVKDDLKWIDSIIELKNTDDVLILIVDFHPKYLNIVRSGSFDKSGTWNGITFIKDEETLYAKGDQVGEVLVQTDFTAERFIEFSKYGTTLVFIKVSDNSEQKIVLYPK